MGKGIALEFKNRFPDMFKDYEALCKKKQVKLGKPYLYKSLTEQWVLNFPTKAHWRSVSRIRDINHGLEYLLRHYKEWGITSLAVPPLGCGQGQLEWRVIGRTLYRYLSRLDIPVELYAPYETPQEQLRAEFLEQGPRLQRAGKHETVKPAWVALVEILNRVEQEPYHWPVGRTIFQKIAYVTTEEGLPTGLEFERGSFGPFSPALKGLITRLHNNGLIYEEPLGRMFAVKVGPTFNDARQAYQRELRGWMPIIEKVADLFVRLRRTSQAELVATVLFAAKALAKSKKCQPSESEVLAEVMKWKQRRRPPINKEDVADTIRNLAALEWLKVKPSKDLPIPDEALLDV